MPTDHPEQDDQPPRVLYGFGARDAAEYHQRLAEQQLVDEVELLAAGYRFLTVEHGDPEDDEQAALVKRLSDTAWATGRVRRTQGGNDYLTIYVEPPTGDQSDADAVVNQLELLAHELNPGWWRIRRSAR